MAGATGTGDQVLVADASDKQLRRALSFQDLFMISFGGVVGSGWLFAVAGSAAIAGPAAVISWVIAGIFMIAIALCFCETASALHKSGQLVRGPLYTHGGYTGYIIGVAYIIGSITVPAIEAEAVVTYAATYEPSWLGSNGLITSQGLVVAVLLLIGFFFLNFVGIRFLGAFNTVVTWWKFIIPILTIIFLFLIFHASNFTVSGGFIPYGWPGVFIAIPSEGIAFAYLGFRGAAQFAGEAKNPQRDAPRAIIYSISAAVVLYVFLQIVFIGAINWSANGLTPGNWAGLSGVTTTLYSAPFYTVMKQASVALLGGFATILLIDAIISPSGTGWVFLGEATRAVYGVGADGFFPRGLLSIHQRTRIPWIALIATTVVGAFFIIPLPSWYLFAGVVTDAFTISLLMGPLTLFILRWHAPGIKRPFQLPAAMLVGGLAFVGGALVIYWSEFGGLFYVFSVLFMVLPLFYLLYAPRNLGIPSGTSWVLGILALVLAVADTAFGYVYLHIATIETIPSSPVVGVSNATLTTYFLIYYVILLVTAWVPALIAQRLASPDGRKAIRSGFWVLTLLFAEMLLAWFSIGGTFPFGPLNGSPYIPFPWDTVAMTFIACGIYAWALLSGYRTKDLAEVETLMQRGEPDAATT